MSQNLKKRSQQTIPILKHCLKTPFWMGLGLVIAIAFTQQTLIYAQSFSQLQLHHVTLSVSDVDLVSQWYADILGFNIRDRFTLTRPDGSKIQVARVEIPGLRMNISQFDGSVSPNRNGERQGWRHIAFQVDSVDDNYQRLRDRGVQFLGEPFTYNPPGYRIAFFRDPEGNILELYQDL